MLNTDVDLSFLQENFPNGQLVTLNKGSLICRIHEKVSHIHWLVSGTIGFYMPLHEGDTEVEVCRVSESFLPLGWNGLNPPGRHTKNIMVASEEAIFYQVKLDEKQSFLETIPNSELHIHVCRKQFALLKQAVYRQKEVLPEREPPLQRSQQTHFESPPEHIEAIVDLMKKSPFLEPFDNADLRLLAACTVRRNYGPEETIINQDNPSDGLYLLIEGNIGIMRYENDHVLTQWPITDKGFIFGWPTLIGEAEYCTAVATLASSAYFIAADGLRRLFAENTDFALRFYTRMNWLVDNHISAAFIRYLGFHFNFNQQTIKYLIESYKTQISTSSKLHQIPHLLNHRTTKYLAFAILEQLKEGGSSRERRIASISIDVLKTERREMEFLNQLQAIYETVAYGRDGLDPQQTRKACAQEVKKLCTLMDFELTGRDNLPDHPGHIFIYNHLVNPAYYTLNNNFQITLDSHFISAMILDEHYGEPGIRTVRIGNTKEFAHQDYYGKLGYINVFTKDSGDTTGEQRAASRDRFFEAAKACLDKGNNLIISPEGTSYHTEDDIPGEFRTGAFALALQAEREPLIVPIVLLNFDKRIHEATKYCKILKPFKLSEHPLYRGPNELPAFVREYRLAFKAELDKEKHKMNNDGRYRND